MAIALSPDVPNPDTDSPTVFSQKAAAFALWMAAMGPQLNKDLAAFNAALAGGAYAFPYAFDASTTDSDPGPGMFRLNTATQNLATLVRIDPLTAAGVDLSGLFNALGNGSSVVRGAMRIVKVADPAQWMLLDFTTIAAPAGYRNISVALRLATSANPFANGDSVIVYFDRAGDMGTSSSIVQIAPPTVINASQNLTFVDYYGAAFNPGLYHKYIIEIQSLQVAAASAGYVPVLQFYNQVSGNSYALDNGAMYAGFGVNGSTGTGLASTITVPVSMDNGNSLTATVEIQNATSGGSGRSYIKGVTINGAASGMNNVNNIICGGGAYLGPAVHGFRLYFNGGAGIREGTVRVYGVRSAMT